MLTKIIFFYGNNILIIIYYYYYYFDSLNEFTDYLTIIIW